MLKVEVLITANAVNIFANYAWRSGVWILKYEGYDWSALNLVEPLVLGDDTMTVA